MKLSDAVQQLPRQSTVFVHGVSTAFLEVGDACARSPSPRFSKGAYYLGKALWGKVVPLQSCAAHAHSVCVCSWQWCSFSVEPGEFSCSSVEKSGSYQENLVGNRKLWKEENSGRSNQRWGLFCRRVRDLLMVNGMRRCGVQLHVLFFLS